MDLSAPLRGFAIALLALPAAGLQAQSSAAYDRVILGGTVMDPATGLNAVRNRTIALD